MPLRAIDFFCGAGGMSLGLHQAGIRVQAGIDCDVECRETYESNIPGARFLQRDITCLEPGELTEALQLEKNDNALVFAGCSPCQYWSKIRTDKTKSEQSAFLLRSFERFIRFFRPGSVVVENVPGLLTKKAESILPSFLSFLEETGYAYDEGVVNANQYGVPQNRTRYVLVASRLVASIRLPEPGSRPGPVVSTFLGVANGFEKIAAGHRDETDFCHTAYALAPQNLERIRRTPRSGGDRSSWRDDDRLQIDAYRGRDEIFRDVYGRMYWDRPAPTITTRFISFSNGRFGHPDEDRAISIREGATLQTFPKTFAFKGANLASLARQIGNAVPPEMARRIGKRLLEISRHGQV